MISCPPTFISAKKLALCVLKFPSRGSKPYCVLWCGIRPACTGDPAPAMTTSHTILLSSLFPDLQGTTITFPDKSTEES